MRSGVLIIQPLPGIGDMIWHLPLIHAIANAVPERKVTILAKPRSHADRLLAADPAVDRILWLERNPGRHDSVPGLGRLVRMVRREGFRQAWILHDSSRYALLASLARIPERAGYGFGLQRRFLTRPVMLEGVQRSSHPVEKAQALLRACSLRAVETEPRVVVSDSARKAVASRWSIAPKPWVAFGIGSSERVKQWGAENFALLADDLVTQSVGSVFLVGGADDRRLASEILRRVSGRGILIEAATGQPVDETAALLEACDCYVGNDTGVLNMAAAVSTPAVGLFGASAPLAHSIFIEAVIPNKPHEGMQGITVSQVAAALAGRAR